MDKDWAEKEASEIVMRYRGDWDGEPELERDISTALRKVRREAIESCAVKVDGWHIKKGGYGLLAQAIRESEGKL